MLGTKRCQVSALQRLRTTKDVNNIAALLLAAGRSERMGAFKPLLPFGDKTIIESSIDTYSVAGVTTIVVVYGWKASEIRAHLRHRGILFAINPDSEGDMGSSIACGVKQLPPSIEAVLISPADLPAIPSQVVTSVLNAWAQGARLVVPTWNDRGGHPVLVDRTFFSELLALDPNLGMRGLFKRYSSEVKRVAVDSQFIARDLDTWDDYRELHKEIFGKTPPDLGS